MSRLDVDGIVRRTPIHEKDNMRSPNRENHYFSVGLDGLRNVLLSMAEARLYEPKTILDFPSGFGRVARYLRAAFPEVTLHVGDTWPDAVKWAASQFRADIIHSTSDFSARFSTRYDVIFCGSLLTHLDEVRAKKLLDFLTAHLAVGGIAIVTSAGRKNLAHEKAHFNAKVFETPEKLESLTKSYYDGNYAYVDYPWATNYGRSFTPTPWFHNYILNRTDLAWIRYSERAWDDNQDVVTLKRLAQ